MASSSHLIMPNCPAVVSRWRYANGPVILAPPERLFCAASAPTIRDAAPNTDSARSGRRWQLRTASLTVFALESVRRPHHRCSARPGDRLGIEPQATWVRQGNSAPGSRGPRQAASEAGPRGGWHKKLDHDPPRLCAREAKT